MLTSNNNSAKAKTQARKDYEECYSTLRRYKRLQELFGSENIEEHWSRPLRSFGPALFGRCFRHWFSRKASLLSGVGSWHGWHNANRLAKWKKAYPAWPECINRIQR